MNNKYKVMISLSLAIAIFYSLPWIALSEQARGNTTIINSRVVYLFFSVLTTSLILFQYNFFWSPSGAIIHRLLNLFFNLALVIIISAILVIVSKRILDINAGRGHFIFYLYRNVGIAFMVMLVT